MNKRGKSVLIISAASIFIISLIVLYITFFASAGTFVARIYEMQNFSNDVNLIEDRVSLINISVQETNSTGPGIDNNITNVTILLYDGFVFINDTDNKQRTSSSATHDFTNSTADTGGMQYLQWHSASETDSMVPNNSINYFWFNVTAQYPGSYNITVKVNYTGGVENKTNLSVTVVDNTNPRVETGGIWNGVSYDLNGTSYNTTTTLNFSCNISDDGGIKNLTLELLGQPGPRFTNFTNIAGERYNQTNFTLTITQPGTYLWRCYGYDNASRMNYSTQSFKVTVNSFSFSGWVKMANFTNATGANISIYEFIQSQQGPPTQRLIKSTTTNTAGAFTLSNVQNNGSSSTIYKIKVTLNNSDGSITEVGPNLPQFPREPLVMSLNGGTFYLQNATTIQIYAHNGTKAVRFGYEVIDQALGFPIESNVRQNASVVNVTVPAGRSYTVMFVRDPSVFYMDDFCTGPGRMNETSCPSPPSSISVNTSCLATPVAGCNTTESNFSQYLTTINKSLAFSQYNLTGCINIQGNANTTEVKVANITAKMIPWEGFIPPMKGEVSDFDVTDPSDLNYSIGNTAGCTLGKFNLTVMGSASGISWMIEAYANGTDEYFAAFQNFTQPAITGERVFNLTLVKVLGTYSIGGDASTSKIEVAIMDSNYTAPQQTHVEVFVRNPVFGTMHYMIETLTNGKFNLTLLNSTTEAKVRVFSNQYAPKETKINLNTNRTNVTLYSFRPMKMLDNGSMSDSKMSGSSMTMKFMKYSTACNVYIPASDCQIGSDNTADFNPLTAMMAGKSNLWMKTSSNVTLYFINVDMMASGPPDAMMNDNASSASGGANSDSVEQLWKFGSMAPDVYDEVRIGIPYNSSVNENLNYTLNFSLLYDNDWNVIWNETANTTAQLPSDYSDFNTTWFGTPGMPCTNASNASAITSCFMNNSDVDGHSGYFWFTIPHFSSTATKIKGSSVTAAATTSDGGGGSGGGGGSTGIVYDAGTLATAVSKELSAGDKITFTIDNRTHKLSLLGMTGSSIVIQITGVRTTLTKTFRVGDAHLIDVNEDGTNDIEVTLKSINLTKSKATLEVRSLTAAAPSAPLTPEENVTSPTTPTAEAPAAEAQLGEKGKSSAMKWILIVSIIIVAIIAVILIIRVAKRK